mmetsp:Transcript_27102/g.87560  ORF Transcript_27102/g.87560 Transcript_27102/m.87560 type:complete len:216 (+) Transcript_27102:1477-2124(+)
MQASRACAEERLQPRLCCAVAAAAPAAACHPLHPRQDGWLGWRRRASDQAVPGAAAEAGGCCASAGATPVLLKEVDGFLVRLVVRGGQEVGQARLRVGVVVLHAAHLVRLGVGGVARAILHGRTVGLRLRRRCSEIATQVFSAAHFVTSGCTHLTSCAPFPLLHVIRCTLQYATVEMGADNLPVQASDNVILAGKAALQQLQEIPSPRSIARNSK